jgi:large subunit ribosomal protein L25
MQPLSVEAALRDERKKNAARRLRRTGQIPGVLYGGQREPLAVAVNAKQLGSILRSAAGHHTLFTVKIAGNGEEKVILKDWQVDPVKGSLLHVDLQRVALDVAMRVKVPVHTFGEPQGVKVQGGVFEMVTREVEIECLPEEIPEEFKVDVRELLIGKQLRAADLPFDPKKIRLVTDPQRVLAHVVALKKEVEVAAPEAAPAEAVPAEPEVIKKGKVAKEAEEGAEAAKGEEKQPRAQQERSARGVE